ncbi:MAG: glutamine synthetase adenylyltransferase, partial [Planctomycetaceae bacterium]
MFEETTTLIQAEPASEADAERMLTSVGFADWTAAHRRLRDICDTDAARTALAKCLPTLLAALSETATPDGSLINFERYVQSVSDRIALFRYLATNPRAVEILVKLFVGSQFLTEILLRNPNYLEQLTKHKRLAEFKSRQQFFEEAHEAVAGLKETSEKLDALRRFQRWELLRIGACDSFRLFDLKSVTVQLALLADSLVQCCLSLVSDDLKLPTDKFAVIAFGKLGGEELNYSSDIDLVFLADADATKYWTLGQRLIRALMDSTGEGFLYRVDMRLRPWGRSGSLVNSVDAHINYLKQHGQNWERQALLKARVIAGNADIGLKFLKRAQPLIFSTPIDMIRQSIREMKGRIEAELERQGRKWGQVKSGEGSIRDVEFVVQGMQLAYGGEFPDVRSFNTLDGLVRLAEFGFLQADEFRELSTGYVFLRTIEHSLQLMHHKQIHALPDDPRELAYLARRLDFPDSELFLQHYRRHCTAIRTIFDRQIGGEGRRDVRTVSSAEERLAAHRRQMEPSYATTFSDEQIQHHAALLDRISEDNSVEIETERLENGDWRVTVVGIDHPGDLSRICGLLFVHGFDILDGNVFTADQVANRADGSA